MDFRKLFFISCVLISCLFFLNFFTFKKFRSFFYRNCYKKKRFKFCCCCCCCKQQENKLTLQCCNNKHIYVEQTIKRELFGLRFFLFNRTFKIAQHKPAWRPIEIPSQCMEGGQNFIEQINQLMKKGKMKFTT